MKQPFFSLITPVYNIERLLEKTIISAIEQKFTNWEMILVDDGSPDNAGMICDKYAEQDERIRVIHKQNEGLAEARNTGIKNCSGKYFIILEGSDTFFDENTLSDIHNTLQEVDVDIYFGRLQDVMENDWKVTNIQDEYCVNGLYNNDGKTLFIKLFENEDVLALSSPVNKVFRTEYVKGNELWFYKGIYHDDDEWLPRAISLSQKAYFSNRVIYNALTWDGCFGQTVSDQSLTKKACDKMFLALHCCKDIDGRFPKEEKSEFKRKFYEYYVRIYISSIPVLDKIQDSICKERVKQSIKDNELMFDYALNTGIKNLTILGIAKKMLGLNFAIWLVLRRYK